MARIRNHSVLKGVGMGLAGGLVGSWTMNQFQALWSKLSADEQQHSQQSQSQPQEGLEPATVEFAKKIGTTVLHRDLKPQEKKIAEPLVHYGYGTFMGGVYGALAEVTPVSTKAVGLPFGAALWLVGDEIAVPALGLSKSPREYPASTHLQSLVAHFVYGMTTEAVRRVMRRVLG
jgi:putative membrane protein